MSSIRFNKITVQNFLSFGPEPQSYSYRDHGLTLVVGKNKDIRTIHDSSNGGGKSSFFVNALIFGLFGDTDKKVKADDVVNKKVGKNCHVRVEFSVNNDSFVVDRYRLHDKHKNALRLFRNGEEITRTSNALTQELIDELVGDQKTFMSSSVFSQENSVNFLRLRTSERKEVVEKILRLEKLTDIQIKLKEKTASLIELKDSLESEIKMIRSEISTKEMAVKAYDAECQRKLEQNRSEYKRLKSMLDKISSVNIDELRSTAEKHKEVVERKRSYLMAYDIKTRMLRDYVSKIKEEFSLKKTIASKRSAIESALASPEKCPVCHGIINKEKLDKYVGTISEEIRKLEENVRKLVDERSHIKNEIKSKYCHYVKSELNEIRIREQELSLKIAANMNTYQILDKIEAEKQRLESTISSLIASSKDIYNKGYVDKLNGEIENLKRKLPEIEQKLASVNKDIKNHSFLIDSLDIKNDRGLKSYIISMNLPIINQRMEYYCFSVFPYRMSVKFNGRFEETIEKDGIEMPYVNLSGGEKKRVDLIVNLVMFDLVRLNYNKSNIMVLDEIMDALDSDGIQVFLSLLKAIAESYNIILISHNDWLKGASAAEKQSNDMFDEIVVVEKENGFSKISVGS